MDKLHRGFSDFRVLAYFSLPVWIDVTIYCEAYPMADIHTESAILASLFTRLLNLGPCQALSLDFKT